MTNQTEPKLSKLPFFLGDAIMIALVIFIFSQSKLPLSPWEVGFVLICCIAGAGLMVSPYVLEYQFLVRRTEAGSLASSLDQIKDLQSLAALIGAATARWQTVQEQSDKTVGAAKSIYERMSTEVAAFTAFLEKANDGEKASLRLEVDKFKRGEMEWVQSIVRMLDHTFALYQAAVRSGQQGLVEQLGNFQNACRDVARRLGLIPFAPAPDESFNPQMHQVADGTENPSSEAKIDQVIATGFTFQGRLVRPALVILRPQISTNELAPGQAPRALNPNGKPAPQALPEKSML